MTFRNLKPSTKDADLLFADELEEHAFFRALRETGFEELFPGSEYVPLKAKDVVIGKDGLQFDLFAKTVMGGLSLSSSMIRRAEKFLQSGKAEFFLASLEDIYLFKAITNRPFPRDYEDLLLIQQTGKVDWDAVYSEYEKQVKGKDCEENLLKKARKLKEDGITNPFIRKIT